MDIKKWREHGINQEISREISQALNLPPMVCDILTARGFDTSQSASNFLTDGDFFDPFLLTDMQKAVTRIHAAIQTGELIAIYGDFDCDGITSTVILYHYLESVGANVTYYIPQRDEGYGLTTKAVDFMKQHGVQLMITVDNGISAIDEVAYASTLGIDIVITDHHSPRETLPAAVAVVDPHRQDCDVPFRNLAGVGVAFKLICALEGDDGYGVIDQYGDLICIGTLADLVELSGENRTIVRRGLALLKNTTNEGLIALMSVAGVQPDHIASQPVVFGLVPRINATGRMGSVDDAVELLLCEDSERAEELARRLDSLNTQRKEIEAAITAELLTTIEDHPTLKYQRMIILAGEGWHHGVVGIVASRIVDRFGKPCLLLSIEGDEARGSGRSVEGFNLVEAVSACSGRLTRYGGHNQAAGLSLPRDEIEPFIAEMLAYCAVHYDFVPAQTIDIDREISPAEISVKTVDELEQLEPFGEGNPSPTFCLRRCTVESVIPVGQGRHVRLRLKKDNQSFFAMCFGMPANGFAYASGDQLDLVCALLSNEYNGERRVTVKVKDLRLSGLDENALYTEKQFYEKYVREESVPAQVADEWTPTRDEVAQVYRMLKVQTVPYGCDAHYSRLCNGKLSYIKVCLIIDLLLERGLASLKESGGMTQVVIVPRADKVDIAESAIYEKIRRLKLV